MYLDPRTLTVVGIVVCMLLGSVSLAFGLGLRHKAFCGTRGSAAQGLARRAGVGRVFAMLVMEAPEFQPARAYAGNGLLAVLMFRAEHAFDRWKPDHEAEPASSWRPS